MAAVSVLASVNIFQSAKARIRSDIDSIVQSLNDKQVEMFAEVDRLEREFKNKQQQQQKELNKLKSLKSQTEELGENNLLAIQQKLIGELEHEISALSLTSKLMPDYTISVAWGFSHRELLNSINSSFIEIVGGNMAMPLLQEQTNTPLYISEDYLADDNNSTVYNMESRTRYSSVANPTIRGHTVSRRTNSRVYRNASNTDSNPGLFIHKIGMLYTSIQTGNW